MSLDMPFSVPAIRSPRQGTTRLRAAIDIRLDALAPKARVPDKLAQAVRYVLLAPGKRLRPLVTLLAVEEFEGDPANALDAGCALEMIHAASLIFDDLPAMDDSRWRRGKPSTHVAFGEDVAILAGLSLLSMAYQAVASAAHLGPNTRAALIGILARAVGTEGLAGGQYEDLCRRERTGAARISRANHLKTGMLFVAAVEMAGAVAGVDGQALEAKRAFASHLGQAFQIMDDLSDTCGGALSCDDRGKPTLPSILGTDQARRRLKRHVTLALDRVRPDGALADLVAGLFGVR